MTISQYSFSFQRKKKWLLVSAASLLFWTCTTSTKTPATIVQLQLGFRSVGIMKVNGLEFKDLNKNNKLDKYEDWRLPTDARIQDLIAQMTIEEKAGFMLISTTRLKGDWSFEQNASKEEITSGFNEKDLVQSMNMFSKKPF